MGRIGENNGQQTDRGVLQSVDSAPTRSGVRRQTRGGFYLSASFSLLFHIALVLLLWFWPRVKIAPAQAQSEPIVMRLMAPPEPAKPAAPADAFPNFPTVQRTVPEPSEEPTPQEPTVEPESDTDTEEQSPVAELPSTPETANPDKIASTPLDEEKIEQWRRELEKKEAEQRKAEKQLAKLSTVVVEAPGAKRPYLSSGADRGTVRELDISRYPEHVQERFFRRFNIRFRRTNRPPPGPRSSYVNAARTADGIYRNSGPDRGPCLVMTLSREVQFRMAQLEMAELRKRDLAPERSHVEEIVFGLREDAGGKVDLTVTRFKASEIK